MFTVLTAVTLTTTILPAPVLRLMDRRAKRAPSGASPPGAPARGAPEEQAPQPSGGPLAPEER
ncbi:hypothetical protein Sgou_06110 [Streptomyces gougerotii]|nr:hypothetical protein [Streptomyces gougerotii]GFH75941.1 hypothetical protein Sgou_06110 [Streptomyces gougerotii]